MPLSVSSSIRLISKGSRMNLFLKLATVTGNVAEKSIFCAVFGRNRVSSSQWGAKSWDRSLSASSSTMMLHLDMSATPLFAKSRIRPGVATSTCTVEYSRMMSSFRLVPPVVTITSIPRCFPSSLHTCAVCSASSRVGTSSSAWIASSFGSMRSSVGIVNAPVLPVPFFARARMSRPTSATGMLSSWIGEGASHPFSKIPNSSSRLR
mmetsp:Transcript_12425/g.27924  ORF Transcript_12425/g.27924 Transcript_12425/m.27924 type:complete len:207 (-) Transcript_12425:84-704(-)